MPLGDIVPEIAVIITAMLVLLVASFVPRQQQWICAVLALAGLAFAAILVGLQIGTSRLTFAGTWVLDGASIWGRMMILGATAFTVLLTPAWLKSDRRHGEYYAILLLSALGIMGLAGAANLLQLTISMLLSSVTGYTLAAYHRDWALSVEAGMKYFLIGALANTVLIIGVALMFGLLGNPGYSEIAAALPSQSASPLLLLGLGLVVVALAFKLGAVPAHAWLPDVAEGAPAPAAAFLTVVPKIGAAIALARLVTLFPPDGLPIRPLIAVISAATMTLGNLAALWQDDMRRMIGWSSVSQAGYALMAVSVIGLDATALPALLFFLLGYAVANLAVFAAVTHLRGRTARQDYAGLGAQRPWVALTLLLGFLSFVGVPPLAGFVGKLMLFVSTINGGYAWLAVIAVANTVVSLFYYLRFIGPIYFAPVGSVAAVLGHTAAAAVFLAAVLIAGFGVVAEPTLGAFHNSTLLP